ncbi:MAG: hypothetical protein ABSH00_09970 [Bryobacteraceae bacterium]|jgi:hypothetical protein
MRNPFVVVRRWVLVIVPLLAWAGVPNVEVRGSEVWVTDDGGQRQLTHDGKAKDHVELSPSLRRIVYIEQCAPKERCTPSMVVLDLEGHRIGSFQACGSPSIAWSSETAVAATCHINPSLEEYFEADTSTGKNIRDLLGYGFTLSPDGKLVAHVGWIIHFAPPYAQSDYLQIEHTTIYPLPEGMRPVVQTDLIQPPTVVRKEGPTYRGIHQFGYGLLWSPDSQRIALTDCTYDWAPSSPGALSIAYGKETGRRCSVAVVSTGGKVALFPIADLTPGGRGEPRLSWLNSRQLSVGINGNTRIFNVQ